jgi:ribokinase
MDRISAFMTGSVPAPSEWAKAAVGGSHVARVVAARERLTCERGARYAPAMRMAVLGHVEHVTLAPVPALPAPGDIVHLDKPVTIAGGGGGVAFFQLAKSDAELHLFTAIGRDDAAHFVHGEVAETGAVIHAALRFVPHTRDLVLVTPGGERTIFVVGRPLHPAHDDRLSWDILASCDGVYFTGEDPETLRYARAAKTLVVTARRARVLAAAGVRADVVVGSRRDPRERSRLADYATPPRALVMTDGAAGGTVETAAGVEPFGAPAVGGAVGAYGAGDTFAAALTWYTARGLPVLAACQRASAHAAAVLGGINPLARQTRLEDA